ncbi:hypothetical protein P8452_20161 [Trifolium repens]|nr:hypothetical protein P8452_20161 [Trifolium repens]
MQAKRKQITNRVEDCPNSSLPPSHNTLTPLISVDDLSIAALEQRISRLERVRTKLKKESLGRTADVVTCPSS